VGVEFAGDALGEVLVGQAELGHQLVEGRQARHPLRALHLRVRGRERGREFVREGMGGEKERGGKREREREERERREREKRKSREVARAGNL
jgi:hypothetical protein